MNKTLILASAALLALTATSCNKQEAPLPTPSAQAGQVTVSFVSEQNTDLPTRAFFDSSSTTEAWEQSLSSLTLFCFGEDGNLLVRRNFTASELAARKTTFSLPRTAAGQSVDFYAIGNTAVGSDVTTKAALLALAETAPSTYNGTFSDVTSKSLRSGGFLMSGYATQTIESGDTPTQVAITLKRDVAKIAVQTSLSSDFSSRYPGSVRITSAKLSRAASQTPYFTGTAKPGAMTFTHTQTPGSTSAKFNNLFYVFENGALGTGSRVLLTLDGIYDRDGDFSTEEDQVAVGYQVELAGASNNGQLVRNGYYRVAVGIAGLAGQDVVADITVANWETPATQNINLGQ